MKSLRVRYLFDDRLHYAEIADDRPVVLPLQGALFFPCTMVLGQQLTMTSRSYCFIVVPFSIIAFPIHHRFLALPSCCSVLRYVEMLPPFACSRTAAPPNLNPSVTDGADYASVTTLPHWYVGFGTSFSQGRPCMEKASGCRWRLRARCCETRA